MDHSTDTGGGRQTFYQFSVCIYIFFTTFAEHIASQRKHACRILLNAHLSPVHPEHRIWSSSYPDGIFNVKYVGFDHILCESLSGYIHIIKLAIWNLRLYPGVQSIEQCALYVCLTTFIVLNIRIELYGICIDQIHYWAYSQKDQCQYQKHAKHCL